MATFRDDFLQKTRKKWQARYEHLLSTEDVREIAQNMTDFFHLLEILDRKYPSKSVTTSQLTKGGK